MADRYLLESGAPDGYLLEDGTGVYLLEVPPASPVTQSGQVTPTNLIASISVQGGYSTVPNLLLTTLALFAANSQLVKREAVLQTQKPAPAVQAFQAPNLLTSTLGVQVVNLPPGHQQTDSSPAARYIEGTGPVRNGVLLDTVTAIQIPIGQQQTDSAPATPRVMLWDRGSNTLLFTTPPPGHQQLDSAPSVKRQSEDPQGSNLPLLAPAGQPIPVGGQETNNLVQTPPVTKDQWPNLLVTTLAVAQQPFPPGRQETDSAPPAQRIGSIVFARGVDPGPPAPASDPLPIGKQETDSAPVARQRLDMLQPANVLVSFPPPAVQVLPIGAQETLSAPYLQRNLIVDQPANLLGSAIGLQPIASAQSESLPTIRPQAVYVWLAPNVTINLPAVAQAIPPGEQRTDSAPAWNAPVQSYTAPNTLPYLPIITPIPQGQQHTDSAPYAIPTLRIVQPVNLLAQLPPPVAQAIPQGQQHTESAPYLPPRLNVDQPVNLLSIVRPIPIGRQWTASAPYAIPRLTIDQPRDSLAQFPPTVAQPLPIGKQKTETLSYAHPIARVHHNANVIIYKVAGVSVFTADSRERIGFSKENADIWRLGETPEGVSVRIGSDIGAPVDLTGIEEVQPQRIGGNTVRVSKWRIGKTKL